MYSIWNLSRVNPWEYNTAMKNRYSNSEIKARLILSVGLAVAFGFLIIVVGIVYSVVFVTQPLDKQAPNDAAFIEKILVPIVLFMSGTLSGMLAANGLKDREVQKKKSHLIQLLSKSNFSLTTSRKSSS
jgi:hypothetical protein